MKPGSRRSELCVTVGSPDPTKTAATNEHRSERSEQLNSAPVRERNLDKWVKLRSSMSCPELRSHLRTEVCGVA